MTVPTSQPANSSTPLHKVSKLLVFATVVFAVYVGWTQYGDSLSLEALAEKETTLRAYQASHPWLVIGGAFFLYVVVCGLSIPGGAVLLTLAYGWYFGWLRAVILVSFASTAGATIAFLVSRYLFRDLIQNKFGDRLTSFNQKLQAEGAFYLFTLRAVPAVPFFMINLVMGLTPMKTRTFWWVSQLGMLAGTMVYVYAGYSVPSLRVLADKGAAGILSWQLILAFVLLGFFPIVVKKLLSRYGKTKDRVVTV